jgi:AcrR family transcriptional regulator
MSRREQLTNLYERYLKKRPRQSRSRTIVEAILRGAAERLAGGGDEDSLRVEDVAERAGVGVGSVYDYFPDRNRLLAGVIAKTTEENLLAFEEVIARIGPLPLRQAIGEVVDVAFAAYLDKPKLTRALVRLADVNRLFPVLVRSQDSIAQQLAVDLARREDVRVADRDAAAWLLTNTLMGAVLAVVWDDDPRIARERIRASYIDMAYAYLTST